jgi:hypothetical protein
MNKFERKDLNNDHPQKSEIFLMLALKQSARQNSNTKTAPTLDEIDVTGEANETNANLNEKDFPALFEQLSKTEAANLRRVLTNYQNKDEAEKADWLKNIESKIGSDVEFIDETVHRSHIENALRKEIPAIRKIVSDAILNNSGAQNKNVLERKVCKAFARQFVSIRQVEKPTAFDHLSGSQLARLVRRAGVREVSIACLRIEAVEAVAAFIRNFPAEDARMIAAYLGNVPETDETRIQFAENLVHTAFELEPNPSAMLDWLGIWLVGVSLCQSSHARIDYTKQKLPLEFVPKLLHMIEENCRRTDFEMQREISGEIEQLAETIAVQNAAK